MPLAGSLLLFIAASAIALGILMKGVGIEVLWPEFAELYA